MTPVFSENKQNPEILPPLEPPEEKKEEVQNDLCDVEMADAQLDKAKPAKVEKKKAKPKKEPKPEPVIPPEVSDPPSHTVLFRDFEFHNSRVPILILGLGMERARQQI